jgi:hypothetical protein
MAIHELEYRDLLLTVHGVYYRGTSDTWTAPGDSEEFEIEQITVGIENNDITDFCDDCRTDIEQLIITTHYR